MSHFSCGVISNDGQTVEELLAPYSESLNVAPYISTAKKELEEEHQKLIKEAEEPGSWANKNEKERHFSYSKMTLMEFTKNHYGDDALIDLEGNLLTTYNPNTKWGWYVIGGRWDDLLKIKSCFGGGRSNEAHISEVDWEALNRISKKDERWYRRFWEINVLGKKMTRAEEKKHEYFSMYDENYYLEYYGNVEKYIKINGAFSTYAVVTPDGVWHAIGKMGMWGFSSEKPEDVEGWSGSWYDNFVKPYFQSKEDHYITILDCHQ